MPPARPAYMECKSPAFARVATVSMTVATRIGLGGYRHDGVLAWVWRVIPRTLIVGLAGRAHMVARFWRRAAGIEPAALRCNGWAVALHIEKRLLVR
jgi:hypothetical protein